MHAKQLEATSGTPEIASRLGYKVSAVIRARVAELLERVNGATEALFPPRQDSFRASDSLVPCTRPEPVHAVHAANHRPFRRLALRFCAVRKERIRWVRVLVAALALSVASTSATLLIRAGQLETAADQAMVEALRQSPGLST